MKTVKELISYRMGISLERISSEDNIRVDLRADSLDFVEIIMDCEKEYDIFITDKKSSTVHTVGDLEKLVEEAPQKPKSPTLKEFLTKKGQISTENLDEVLEVPVSTHNEWVMEVAEDVLEWVEKYA